jgi:hypothetical protein
MKKIVIIIGIICILLSSVTGATKITCDNITAKVNQDFEIEIHCIPSTYVKAFEARLSFNASVLQANFIREGNFFDGYQTFKSPGLGIIDNGNGSIKNIYGLIVGKGNVSTSGSLFIINFTGLKNGSSPVVFDMMLLTNETKYLEDVNATDGLVTIDGYMLPHQEQNDTQNETVNITQVFLFENFFNATGTHEKHLGSLGWYIYANATGNVTHDEPGVNDEPNNTPPQNDVDPLTQWTGNIVMVLIVVFLIIFLFSRLLG